MKKTKRKQFIKIPNNVEAFFNKQTKTILFKSFAGQKSLKIDKQLIIYKKKQQIEVTTESLKKLSNSNKKKIQLIHKTTISFIKQLLIETTALTYKKLKLIGVGYRAIPVEKFKDHLLLLKLGYSHPIYFKPPVGTKIVSLRFTKIFLSSYSFFELTSVAAKIRLNKMPEPYKGKGILYENEKIRLKEGKKI